MIKGQITCDCGQYFIFETVNEIVYCPACGKEFVSLENGTEVIDVEPIVE